MIITLSLILIFLLVIQEIFDTKSHLKLLLHFFLFFLLIYRQEFLFAIIIIVGGVLVELSLFELDFLGDTKKRVKNRYRYTIFLSLLMSTFVISSLVYNSHHLKFNISITQTNEKLLFVLVAYVIGMFLMIKGRKWK